ncbi:MAG: MATE family efflux transporter [Bacteroidota bacterium]|nr:MATE family efflux transporter [Bacteroidota bacterium]
MNLSVYTKEFSKNIKLAYPVILGMIGHTLTGIIDNIMVGNLGATELAAVSLGNSFVFVAMSIGIGFSTAITPLVAQRHAQKDVLGTKDIFHHGLFLCTLIGIILFGAVYLLKPIIQYMGQSEQVLSMVYPYIDVVAFSLIFVLIFQGYKQFADGMSKTKYSMYSIFISNFVNLVVNFVLIYGFWIFPKMGIIGAAIGTLVSRLVMIVVMHYLLKKDAELKLYFQGINFRQISKELINKIVKIGFPSALITFFEVVLFASSVWLTGAISPTAQAANQIALSLATMTFMFAMGFSVTAMIRVGNQNGLKDFEYLKVVARSIMLLTLILQVFFAMLFVLLNHFLPQLFLDMNDTQKFAENMEVTHIASKLLLVAAIFQVSDGLQTVLLGALRGIQDVKIPAYITFFSYWIVGFPICMYLGLHTNLMAEGVWIGLFIGLTVSSGLLYMRFEKIINNKIKENGVTKICNSR